MLERVEIRTDQGLLLNLPLQDVSGGFQVEDITNLGPVTANHVASSFAKLKGARYQGSKQVTRNPVFTLGLKPTAAGVSVETLRNKLYQYFMTGRNVHMRFVKTGGFVVDISGVVEECDCPLFVKEPKATISVICYDPDFIASTETVISGVTTSGTDEMLVEYNGTIETGVELELIVDRPVTSFSIFNTPPNELPEELEFAGALAAGDVLSIRTHPGAKTAFLDRGGAISSYLYGVTPTSDWLQLKPGENSIRWLTTGDPMIYNLRFRKRYGGL